MANYLFAAFCSAYAELQNASSSLEVCARLVGVRMCVGASWRLASSFVGALNIRCAAVEILMNFAAMEEINGR